jgi:hypothetical protein
MDYCYPPRAATCHDHSERSTAHERTKERGRFVKHPKRIALALLAGVSIAGVAGISGHVGWPHCRVAGVG